jgi:hypothetical protein
MFEDVLFAWGAEKVEVGAETIEIGAETIEIEVPKKSAETGGHRFCWIDFAVVVGFLYFL